jgi:hypothetical protein
MGWCRHHKGARNEGDTREVHQVQGCLSLDQVSAAQACAVPTLPTAIEANLSTAPVGMGWSNAPGQGLIIEGYPVFGEGGVIMLAALAIGTIALFYVAALVALSWAIIAYDRR